MILDISLPYQENSLFGTIAGKFIILSGIVLSFLSGFGPNPMLIIPSWVVLFFLFRWFATDNFPPVLLVALLYQWIQVSIKVIYSTITLTEFRELHQFPEHIIQSYLLSSASLLVFSFGIYSVTKRISFKKENLERLVLTYDTRKLFIFYFLFLVFSNLLLTLRHTIPGLFQLMVSISYLKWAIFFVLFYTVYSKQENKAFLWGLILLEFLSGFVSYFASFKDIILIVAICYLTVRTMTETRALRMSVAAMFVLGIGLFWTAVKGEYRSFLNQGSGQQVVAVEADQALSYLSNKVVEVDEGSLSDASTDFLDRISYIDYFSSAIAYVPSELPHENGLLTRNAIFHILMPRMFFPNKASLDDSQHLTKYTGVVYADQSMGVSFALGYVGDFYVDWGPLFMFIPIFLFGLAIGYIHNSIFRTSPDILWACAFIVPLFFLLYKFENSLIKFVGNLIFYWLTILLVNKYVAPRIINYIKD